MIMPSNGSPARQRGVQEHFVALLVFAAGTVPLAHAQRAEDYPARAVRVIIPFSPGGPPDVIGRPLLQKLSEGFNQPFVFDNRPGASGITRHGHGGEKRQGRLHPCSTPPVRTTPTRC